MLKRSRSRLNGRSKPKPNNFEHYDSRVKANAQQNFDKYNHLGREAMTSGDRIAAESYYQHAEHYLRILNDIRAQATKQAMTYQRPPSTEESFTITMQSEENNMDIHNENENVSTGITEIPAPSSEPEIPPPATNGHNEEGEIQLPKPKRKGPPRTSRKTPKPSESE